LLKEVEVSQDSKIKIEDNEVPAHVAIYVGDILKALFAPTDDTID